MTSLLQPGMAWHILLAWFYAFYAIFNSYLFLILSVLIWLADVIVRSIMAYTYLHVLILYFGSVIWFISGAMFALYELFFPHEIRALGRSENLRGTSSISRHFQRESFAYILAKIWGEWPPYPLSSYGPGNGNNSKQPRNIIYTFCLEPFLFLFETWLFL